MVSATVASICLSFTIIGCAATCPAQVFTAKTGEFMSPGYPVSLYPNNQRCRYTIKAGSKFIIEITFNDFELQPSSNGRRTDFVKLIDGFAKNPRQVVYYDGTMETPFTFVSKQRRVVIVFSTTRQINKRGFHATYRLFKEPKYCDYPSLKYGWGECIEAGDEEFFSSCNITCDFGFQLDGNMTSQCNTDVGNWTELPNCALSPEILEICTKDITNVDCIYAPDVIAEYYRGEGSTEQTDEQLAALIDELGDELSEFEEDELPLIGKTQGTSVKCKKFLCLYNKAAGAFVYHCPKLANAVQKKRRLNATKKQNWINFCFQCQNSGCSRGGSGL